MNIIGIAGQLGNGKDVLAERLETVMKDRFGESWNRKAWADGLKDVFYNSFGVNREFTEEWKRKKETPPGFNISVRESLQKIGDEFRQIKSDVWIDWTFSKLSGNTIITDCRYENELRKIQNEGGINILVIRPDHFNKIDHPSEAQIRNIVEFFTHHEGPTSSNYIDYVIRNDGTLEDFFEKIDNHLVPYISSQFEFNEKQKISMSALRRNFVPKGWGFEDWIENNSMYCGKRLFFIKDRGCSWHAHYKKDETFYVQDGRILLIYSNQDCLDKKGNLCVYPHECDLEFPVIKWDWITFTETVGEEASFTVLEPGDCFRVSPGMRHAMYGLKESNMFEFSTQHFDDDTLRIHKGD